MTGWMWFGWWLSMAGAFVLGAWWRAVNEEGDMKTKMYEVEFKDGLRTWTFAQSRDEVRDSINSLLPSKAEEIAGIYECDSSGEPIGRKQTALAGN